MVESQPDPWRAPDDRGLDSSFELTDDVLSAPRRSKVTYRIAYTSWSAVTPSKGVAIVYNHGLQSHRGWVRGTAARMSRDGYAFYAFDRIGAGESSGGVSCVRGRNVEARGHVRSWRLFVETLDAMIGVARAENPGARIVLWGNSYGAKIVTARLLSEASDVACAVFTSPGLYANESTMPLPFPKIRLLLSGPMARFPVPMVEKDGDRGASWFVSGGVWNERIRADRLSIRDVTRTFLLQTRSLDRWIASRPGDATFRVPTFHLLVRGDRMMDNERTVRHVERRAPLGIRKFYAGGPSGDHLLLFTSDAPEAIGDVEAFLDGRVDEIAGAIRTAGR